MHVRKVDDTTLYYGRLHLLWLVLIAAIRMTITAIHCAPTSSTLVLIPKTALPVWWQANGVALHAG